MRADGVGVVGGGGEARRLGRNVVEQAEGREAVCGERDGTCPLCHLDVILLTGGKSIARRVGRGVG